MQDKLRSLAGKHRGDLSGLSAPDRKDYHNALTAYEDRLALLIRLKLKDKRDEYFKQINFPLLSHEKLEGAKAKDETSKSASTSRDNTDGDKISMSAETIVSSLDAKHDMHVDETAREEEKNFRQRGRDLV